MKIFAEFTPIIKIILWIMFAISLVCVVITSLVLCGVALPLEVSPAQASLLLFSTSLVTVFSSVLATMHYQITETHLRLNVAFFDVLGGRIRLDKILNIVYKDGNMYISYLWQGADPVIAQIAVAPKHFDKIKNELMNKNKNILFFDEDKNKGN